MFRSVFEIEIYEEDDFLKQNFGKQILESKLVKQVFRIKIIQFFSVDWL